ncbi:DnaA regulatory inactivator Hda [Idiomarina seosinensis]|uniref:DnaA regulatory inactivator Hda n=1 Tax=Idiomarina seosinensis TaxID=281739 RepID=UPI0038500609
MNNGQPQQLPLQVQLPDDELFATFFSADNGQVIDWLTTVAISERLPPQTSRYSWLSGPAASGKSHLLHATVAAANEQFKKVMYLPMKELQQVARPAAVLEGLEQFDVLCVDDVDQVLDNKAWCFELFALINRITDAQQCRLIMTASQAAAQSEVHLADLKSRLQWATAYQLSPLADTEKAQALTLRASWRGLQLPPDVAQFMLHRLGRNMRQLLRCLNKLDTASMAQQRRLTIPFVKQTLSI